MLAGLRWMLIGYFWRKSERYLLVALEQRESSTFMVNTRRNSKMEILEKDLAKVRDSIEGE